MKLKNKAIQGVFEEFLNLIGETAKLKLPILDDKENQLTHKLPAHEAIMWFGLCEPLIFKLVSREMPMMVEGKALILAERDGVELPERLVMNGQEVLIEIDGEKHDAYLRIERGHHIETYSQIRSVISDDDVEDFDYLVPKPILSAEEQRMLRSEWAIKQANVGEIDGGVFANPAIRAIRYCRANFVRMPDGQFNLTTFSKERRKQGRRSENVKGVTIPIIRSACAEQARIGSKVGKKLITKRVWRRGEIVEEDVLTTVEILPALEKVRQPESRLQAGMKWGLFLDQKEGAYHAPKSDFTLAEKWFKPEQLAIDPPILEVRGRMTSKYAAERVQYAEEALRREAIRQMRLNKDEEASVEQYMGRLLEPRYPIGEEPPLYLLGKKTGNLYPAELIRYIGYLREHLKVNSKSWRITTPQLVMIRLKEELPWLPEEAEDLDKALYRNDWIGKELICYEDELFVLNGDQIKIAPLHRFFGKLR
jgi:hypothetical protein